MTTQLRRWGPWVLLVAVTTAVAVLLATPTSEGLLDPINPGRDGGQAVAEVLDDQGVTVEVLQGSRPLSEGEVAVGPGTTVLLPDVVYLGPDSGPELVSGLRDVDRLVVLVPDAGADPGTALGLDVDVRWSSQGTTVPDCDSPLVSDGDGDPVSRADALLSAGGADRAEVVACYPPGPGHNAGGAREGALLSYPATADRPEIILAALTSAWTNVHVTEEANAALALRVLGGSDRLVWVMPQPTDATADVQTSLWEVLPRNLTSWVWLLVVATLTLAVWRGRRLGPVVTEPLPAVVHAIETTRSRGRLYRQAKDRTHALRAAQAGSRRRIAPRLGLPGTVDPERLVGAVADSTGRGADEVHQLLLGAEPADDDALVAALRALRDLEDGLALQTRVGLSSAQPPARPGREDAE